jgi:hypothetical protein
VIELQYETGQLAAPRYVDVDPASIESVGDRTNGDGKVVGSNVRTRSGLTHEVTNPREEIKAAMQTRTGPPGTSNLGFR